MITMVKIVIPENIKYLVCDPPFAVMVFIAKPTEDKIPTITRNNIPVGIKSQWLCSVGVDKKMESERRIQWRACFRFPGYR